MTMMKTSKTILSTIALVCALSTGALADTSTTEMTNVAVDAESLKKFLEDQPKLAAADLNQGTVGNG